MTSENPIHHFSIHIILKNQMFEARIMNHIFHSLSPTDKNPTRQVPCGFLGSTHLTCVSNLFSLQHN